MRADQLEAAVGAGDSAHRRRARQHHHQQQRRARRAERGRGGVRAVAEGSGQMGLAIGGRRGWWQVSRRETQPQRRRRPASDACYSARMQGGENQHGGHRGRVGSVSGRRDCNAPAARAPLQRDRTGPRPAIGGADGGLQPGARRVRGSRPVALMPARIIGKARTELTGHGGRGWSMRAERAEHDSP